MLVQSTLAALPSSLGAVCLETRHALIDMIRGDRPSTVIGLLVARGEPLEVETIAALLGRSIEETRATVDMLEREDLCSRIAENGLSKVVAFAPYSARNAVR